MARLNLTRTTIRPQRAEQDNILLLTIVPGSLSTGIYTEPHVNSDIDFLSKSRAGDLLKQNFGKLETLGKQDSTTEYSRDFEF